MLGAPFGRLGAELLRKEEGGTAIGGGSARGSSPVPSPPWCPQSCGNIPPSPLLLLLSASSALPPFLVAAAGA